jgi:outer membrane protein W
LSLSDSYEKETKLTIYPRATYNHNMSAWLLGGKLGLRYTYPKGSFRPFAEAGFNMVYLSGLSNVYRVALLEDYSRSVPQKFFTGYYGGIGVNCLVNKKHFITVSLSYEGVRATFIPDYIPKDKMRNILFKVGYMF